MKQVTREMKDDGDEKNIALFVSCGLNGNAAKCLCYLTTHERAMSTDIESTMDMRQPEVSVGLRDLRRGGFVSFKKIPKKGKGRPLQEYAMREKSEIYSKLKEELQERVKMANHNMMKLDMLFSSMK